jgi:hypothetical protein
MLRDYASYYARWSGRRLVIVAVGSIASILYYGAVFQDYDALGLSAYVVFVGYQDYGFAVFV